MSGIMNKLSKKSKKSKKEKKEKKEKKDKKKDHQEPTETVIDRDAILKEHGMQGEVTMDDFDIIRTVGTGTFGRVMVCKFQPTGKYYAVKAQKKSAIVRMKQVQHCKNEKDILLSINHPYIVNMIKTFQDESRVYLVLEFVTGGEMFSHLRRARTFDNERAKIYAAEIVSAFAYLHSHDVIYRDLKPENLLLDEKGHVKITDFGFAKVVPDRTYTVCGTPEYIAPEIIRSQGHSYGADWWALGVLIYEMLAGYPPFFDEDPFGIYEKILSGAPVAFPSHFHKDAKDLISKLLQHDLTKRFGCMRHGATDIKKHKWFKSIDWTATEQGTSPVPWTPKPMAAGDCKNFDKYAEEDISPNPADKDRFGDMFSDF